MPKYSCNNCGNTFAGAASAQLKCPACGSNSVQEMQDHSKKSILQDKKIIILAAVVLLMIIVLFFLRTPTKQYNVDIEPYPDSCMFKIIVKAGDDIKDPAEFRYSVDNVHWQKENIFREKSISQYKIQVKYLDDTTRKFIYNFVQPYTFNPTCNTPVENPCDCKHLQIKSVGSKFVNGKYVLLIEALPFGCPKVYSFTGKGGKYTSDSTLAPQQDGSFEIYVKTDKCEPIAYFDNPVKYKKPVATGKIQKAEIEKQLNKLISEYPDPKVPKMIMTYFQDDNVPVHITQAGQRVPDVVIAKFLNDLEMVGSTNYQNIKVKFVTYNGINKISELYVERILK
jgi:hypothetical protein